MPQRSFKNQTKNQWKTMISIAKSIEDNYGALIIEPKFDLNMSRARSFFGTFVRPQTFLKHSGFFGTFVEPDALHKSQKKDKSQNASRQIYYHEKNFTKRFII